MFESVFGARRRDLLDCPGAEGAAGSRRSRNLLDMFAPEAVQRLEHRRMLGIDRNQDRAAARPLSFMKNAPAETRHSLFEARPWCPDEGPPMWRQAGGTNNRGHDKIGGPGPCLDQRRFTSSETDARSLKEQAKLFRHGFHRRAPHTRPSTQSEIRQRLGVPIAVSATAWKRSGWRARRSQVCCPIVPVAPSTLTRFVSLRPPTPRWSPARSFSSSLHSCPRFSAHQTKSARPGFDQSAAAAMRPAPIAAKTSPSRRSSTPPCPGISPLKSLTPKKRLMKIFQGRRPGR